MLRQLQGQPAQEQHRVAEHLPASHKNHHPIQNRARLHRKQQLRDPERHDDDDVETNVRNNQRHDASTNQLNQGSPPYLGSSIAFLRNRTISGYNGDSEDDDTPDGGIETAKRQRSK